MKYQDYTNFQDLPRGCYFVLRPKNKLIAEDVYIYEGRCFNSSRKKMIPVLKNCFLQKCREINWAEEGDLDELLEKVAPVKPVKKTITQQLPKKSETERRREYFDSFESPASTSSGKKYVYNTKTIQRNPAQLIA